MLGVGDEVVCINDSEPAQRPPNVVVKGQTYTITGIEVRPFPIGRLGPMTIVRPTLFVFLKEVPSPQGIGFFAFRFRKVEKKKRETSIEVFQEIRREVERTVSKPAKKTEKA